MDHGMALKAQKLQPARPFPPHPTVGDRRLGVFLALGVALAALVAGVAQWQHGIPTTPDDVGAVLFQNG